MNPKIRPMKQDECDVIKRIFHDVWHETQAQLQDQRKAKLRDIPFFRARIEMPDAKTLVAADGNTVVGFVLWSPGNLHSLFVSAGHRSKGIGENLCAAAVRANNNAGGGPMVLDCVEGNWAARRFYERLGWCVKEIFESKDEIEEGQILTRYWIMVKP
jgi:ribosomal protein S18 acetylase RimI-like enzyme